MTLVSSMTAKPSAKLDGATRMQPKRLSQVDTIRSLGEALAWFQRELSWGVAPAALPHLTGRIGELFAAVTLDGEMATAVNQRGYDVMVRDTNERVSVKTVTSSSHVTFRGSTFEQADRVFVLRIAIDGDEISIKPLLNVSAVEAKTIFSVDDSGNYIFAIRNRRAPIRPLAPADLLEEVLFDGFVIKQYINGTILVECDGAPVQPAIVTLRTIAQKIGVDPLNANGNPRNTRQLGAEVVAHLITQPKDSSIS